jgi:mono/diheme cytochrome c family protein
MKKLYRNTLYAALGLAGLVVVAGSALLVNSQRKINRTVSVAVAPVAYATDAAAAERGKYLYTARGCAECHGADGAGRVFIDEDGLYVRGANITTGNGGAVRNYTELDWARTIRHGVKPDGRPAFIMPSEDFNRLSDQDLADVVAYTRSLPPQDAPGAQYRLPLIVQLVHGAGLLTDAAEKIDHTLPPAQHVAAAPTADYGRYVAQTCVGCHSVTLKGGKINGAPPDWPPSADLTLGTAGVMARYPTLDQFKTAMRTGKRPDGSEIFRLMRLEQLSDVDLEALYKYLQSPSGQVTQKADE